MIFRNVLCALAGLAVAGCGTLPYDGPLRKDIEDQAGERSAAFDLVDVSPSTVRALRQRSDAGLARLFGAAGDTAPRLVIGSGDAVSISIWEAGSQPLFSPSLAATAALTGVSASSHSAVLPEQVVDADGCVTIPFAGCVKVAGSTPTEAQAAIEKALARKAAQPQVLVGVTRSPTNSVTVVGEVVNGGRVGLSARGERLLDVIAGVGGVHASTFETQIGVRRGALSGTVSFKQLLSDPAENIYVQPGDVVTVMRHPETFTAFGATGRNAQINFDAPRVSLVEAVAKAGGLLDQRADPRGVFLFREEPADVVTSLRGSASAAGTAKPGPVVYRLDLTRADGYFLAGNFDVRDGDVLFVSSAPANELQKFLQLVGLITVPAANAAILNNATK